MHRKAGEGGPRRVVHRVHFPDQAAASVGEACGGGAAGAEGAVDGIRDARGVGVGERDGGGKHLVRDVLGEHGHGPDEHVVGGRARERARGEV